MSCSKGMRGGCYALCGHRAKVQDYRDERMRQYEDLIESTGGYETEIEERLRDQPLITFKDYLIQTKRGEKRWSRASKRVDRSRGGSS